MSTKPLGRAEAVATFGLCAFALCAVSLAASCEEDVAGPQGATPLGGASPRAAAVAADAGAGKDDERIAKAQALLRERHFAQARDLLAPAGKPLPEPGTAARVLLDKVDLAELAVVAREGNKDQASRILERRSPEAREELLARPLDSTSPLLAHCLFKVAAGPEDQRGHDAPFPAAQAPRASVEAAPPSLEKVVGTWRLRTVESGNGYRLELRAEGGKLKGAGWRFPFACPAVLFDPVFEPGRLLLVHRDVSDSPIGASGPKVVDELDLDLALDASGALAGPYLLARSEPVVSDIRESRLDCDRGTIVRDPEAPTIGCFTEVLETRPPWAPLVLSSNGGLSREEWLRRVGQPVGQDGVRVAWTVDDSADPACPRLPWVGSTRMTGVVSAWNLKDHRLEVDVVGSGTTQRRCKVSFHAVPAPEARLEFAKAKAAKVLLEGKVLQAKNPRCASGRCLAMGPYPLVCGETPEAMRDAPHLAARVKAVKAATALDVRYRFLTTARREVRADLVIATPGVPESAESLSAAATDLKPLKDKRYKFDSGWKTAHVALPEAATSPAEIGFELRGTARACKRFIPHGKESNEGEALLLVQSVAASAKKK